MSDTLGAAPAFFTEPQRKMMFHVLNRIIPPGDGFPGAGDLGIVRYLDAVVSSSAQLKRRFTEGLARIEIAGQEDGPAGFASLRYDAKDKVLRQVESALPEFFASLVKQTYNGYYTNATVLGLLGPEVRAPQPLGHDVEPGDLSTLEAISKRGTAYRPV
ncbi:MAG: gluconate 2-dehydrogenase subunit 3 family protein [Dehalococcoidia bacterium]|jgi:hypothetical protein|nr:gluconate 2-dehydrogenase subunit 3 family protein [Dehalococcoidia bacterium]|tara:strand:- start:210 stop:686 length:477 start_codon:yes stop_codon:yes gene_type:complete